MADECVFCRIIEGKIPCSKVYEDKHYIAFLDIHPANKGHTLIVPKRHAPEMKDLNKDELCGLAEVAQKVANAVQKVVKSDGFNLLLNNGKSAGQIIFHAHFHIIPRWHGDGMHIKFPRVIYGEGEMEGIVRKVGEALKKN